jgi:hypothetical protein
MNMQRLDLRLVKNTTIIVLTILCVGCAAKKLPSQSDIANANYGSPKSIQEFEEKVRQGLKDPYSAKISCSQPKKGWFEIKKAPCPNMYGYVSVCQVNAKNGFGAYTGEKPHFYSFVGEACSFVGKVGTFDAGFFPIDDILITEGLFEFHPVP